MKWIICVVAAVEPKKYKNFYVAVDGEKEEAHALQDVIVRRGFQGEGQRIFPDQIETVTVKEGN